MARLLLTLAIFSFAVLSSALDAPSCTAINREFVSCIPYVESNESENPSRLCCEGVNMIAGSTVTKEDQQAVCNCIKIALLQLGNHVVSDRVSDLPRKCGLPIDLPPINKDTDCSKVSWM